MEGDRNQTKQGSILKIFYVPTSHHHKGNSVIVSFLYKINLKAQQTHLAPETDNWEQFENKLISFNYKQESYHHLKLEMGTLSENYKFLRLSRV